MKDETLRELFTGQVIPPVDTTAKTRALTAAMGAFAEQYAAAAEPLNPTEVAPPKHALGAQPGVMEPNNSSQNSRAEKKPNFFIALAQGFLQRLRLTHTLYTSRSNNMNFTPKRFMFSGLATCAAIAVGAVYFNQYPWRPINPEIVAPSEHVAPAESVAQIDINVATKQLGAQAKADAELLIASSIELEKKFANNSELKRKEIAAAAPEKLIEAVAINAPPADFIAQAPSSASITAPAIASVAADKAIAAAPSSTTPPAQIPPARAAKADIKKTEAVAGKHNADTLAPVNPQEFRDRFETFNENPVTAVTAAPVSTFSIDVDTAAYSFTRRQLNSGHLPAKDAVRIEEMVNYFPYNYPLPESKKIPFKPSITLMDSPFKAGNKLVHIGIKGYQIPNAFVPRSNLVFLLDVSGSMNAPDKLPLVQQSMSVLLETLKPDDTVAIVVYAGAAGMVLEPTLAKEKTKILAAINNLQPGGATAGAEGIALAYQLAEAHFNPKGVNRIILATDGDFNVGPTGDKNLKDYVERKREKGIYLSVLGFGQGNYQDAMMQTLAQNGNGIAAYIDTLSEAQKVLVQEATSTLFPIANDVKIQVEFNPASVAEYRLLGYETRALKREDFNNDKVDAGEIGAGHSVTAIYEITPKTTGTTLIDPSRYTAEAKVKKIATSEYGFLRIRYKLPGETKSQLIEAPILINVPQTDTLQNSAPQNTQLQNEAQFATAVAGFSQLLRGSAYSGDMTYDKVIELAQKTKGQDDYGYRTEFIQLVRKAKVAKAL